MYGSSWFTRFICFFVMLPVMGFSAGRACADSLAGAYFSLETLAAADGRLIEKLTISGPPTPPPGYELERAAVRLPAPDTPMAVNTLTVPAYEWVFGCSAVSGAMIAAYYDRNGFDHIYTGATGGGVMPLVEDAGWGTWSDGSDTYPNNPLIASHLGLEGRATRGSIDDYWVSYQSGASDPYISGAWTQHTPDAIGDYMKTSQSAYGNTDGSTTFYTFSSSADQLTCSDMETYTDGGAYLSSLDGTYGRKLFYEARGYTVTDCYNQKTDNVITGGFSFEQYKAEIDAGRPVLINIDGHSMAGVGYDDATETMYIHDTWDNSDHTMAWGGSYAGMPLRSVSIVTIAGGTCTDNDGDGYGLGCPAGTDCDDGDAGVHATATYYADADGDGYGAATADNLCAATAPPGYVINDGDCDDTDAAIHATVTYYVDYDGDGYGSTTTAEICSAAAPEGYATNNTDCNDRNAAAHTTATYYLDADADGYGSGASATLCADTAPSGYAGNNDDCDDHDAAVHAATTYYVDADGDGCGSTATARVCADTAPAGYATDSSDCDDSDAFYCDVCPDSEAKLFPRTLRRALGETETTRRLLVIGPRGVAFDDTTDIRWNTDAVTEVGRFVLFKRFMLLKVSLDGSKRGSQECRALIGTCSAATTLVVQ